MAETVEELKARKAWLLAQVKVCDKAIEKLHAKALRDARPAALELPGVPPKPPRKVSENEERHADFQTMRATKLKQLGVEFVEDETNEPAFIAVTMKKLRAACGNDDQLLELFNAYLASPAPARYTPPYPLRALAADKWWRPLLETLRAQSVEH